MTNTGANIPGTPNFFVGLCSGTSAIFGDASPTHAVGVNTFAATWVYTAGNHYSSGGSSIRPTKQIAAAVTNGAALGTSGCTLHPVATATQRAMYFVDITKGSPNYTFESFGWNAGAFTDVSATDFILQAGAAVPVYTSHSLSGTSTLAVDEADGVLDCINISWDIVAPTIELCDVAVARLA